LRVTPINRTRFQGQSTHVLVESPPKRMKTVAPPDEPFHVEHPQTWLDCAVSRTGTPKLAGRKRNKSDETGRRLQGKHSSSLANNVSGEKYDGSGPRTSTVVSSEKRAVDSPPERRHTPTPIRALATRRRSVCWNNGKKSKHAAHQVLVPQKSNMVVALLIRKSARE